MNPLPEDSARAALADFKCPICASHYFGPIFEAGQHVGRYCKGWPSGFDRSYAPCRGKHEERFAALTQPTAPSPPAPQQEPEYIVTLNYLTGHQHGLDWAADLVEADDPRTGDWVHDDRHELGAAIRKGPEMPPVDRATAPQGEVPRERTSADYAIEHAEYMANGVERLIDAINVEDLTGADDDAPQAHDDAHGDRIEAMSSARNLIHEFRKRRERHLQGRADERAAGDAGASAQQPSNIDDGDGHCIRCGYSLDADDEHECPPGFANAPWPRTVTAQQAEQASDAQDAAHPRLTVRLTAFPESNGKRNWTAMFVRVEPFDGLIGNCGGITIARGELWNRVAYEAERAKFLLGERDTEPFILDYGDDIKTPDLWAGEVRGRAAITKDQA